MVKNVSVLVLVQIVAALGAHALAKLVKKLPLKRSLVPRRPNAHVGAMNQNAHVAQATAPVATAPSSWILFDCRFSLCGWKNVSLS